MPGQARSRSGDEVRGVTHRSAASDKARERQQSRQLAWGGSDPGYGSCSVPILGEPARDASVLQCVTHQVLPRSHLRARPPQPRVQRRGGRRRRIPLKFAQDVIRGRPEDALARATRAHAGLRGRCVQFHDHRPLPLRTGISHSPANLPIPQPSRR